MASPDKYLVTLDRSTHELTRLEKVGDGPRPPKKSSNCVEDD